MAVEASPVCRLAICDDVATFRQLLTLLFGLESDFEIVGEAANGREAIDVVESTRADVLLLDLAMPVMDGMEALPHIRQASPDTKVVMLTGFGSAAMQEQAAQLGAVAYLEKGLAPAELIRAVRDVHGLV